MSDSQSQLVRVQGFQKPQKPKKEGKPRKARRGWGPYRSVLNERSAAFNLTLDVQSLKQEVDNLAALRAPSQFYRVFRHGGRVQQLGQKRLLDQDNQRDFMHSVMDVHVDVGNGLKGPDVMMQQMVMYSTVLSSVYLKMQSFVVVQAEDSVVVRTHSTLHFQIQRATVESVFPHVMNNEWLVQQLVGKEVEPKMDIAFYFNEAGKCVKYAVELDFVGAFISIVQVPMVVNMLLGRALIADNCMLGVIDEPLELVESAPLDEALRENMATDDQDKCLGVVDDYYLAFANGFQDYDSQHFTAALQRNFLCRCAN